MNYTCLNRYMDAEGYPLFPSNPHHTLFCPLCQLWIELDGAQKPVVRNNQSARYFVDAPFAAVLVYMSVSTWSIVRTLCLWEYSRGIGHCRGVAWPTQLTVTLLLVFPLENKTREYVTVTRTWQNIYYEVEDLVVKVTKVKNVEHISWI